MRSWPGVPVPTIPGEGPVPQIRDSASGQLLPLRDPASSGPATLYVCGITPYDATHLGHAATYVTFDIVGRVLRDAGHEVVYAQNVTDVDDPLLERAERDQVDWVELAEQQTQLFRDDMTALRVLPPDHYVGVVESVERIGAAVRSLLARGLAYRLASDPVEGQSVDDDVYLDLTRCPDFGATSGWDADQMMSVFAERGGDPDRAGKRTPFDPLLWRAARPGEPAWAPTRTTASAGTTASADSVAVTAAPGSDGADGADGVDTDLDTELPAGRPGWHIECTAIAQDALGLPFDIQGGGVDLIFPHHEMSAVQGDALTGHSTYARRYVHQEMVAYDGHKMSKSRGNLVLVSKLRAAGADPMAIRTALLAHRYDTPWEWQDEELDRAVARLNRWRQAAQSPQQTGGTAASGTQGDTTTTVLELRAALADNLDTPRALAALDAWADQGGKDADQVRQAVDALLGITL